MGEFTTVGDLIKALQEFPPNATIAVKASCCSHAHPMVVRASNENDWEDDSDVILDASV